MNRSHGDTPSVLRGRIYGAQIEDRDERYYLAVSNNQRNARLGTFLAVRSTTTHKPALPSIVQLSHTDARWTGSISCDDIDKIYTDEITRDYGGRPVNTLRRVDDALRAALNL